ncbi:TRFL7 [Hirschfeldia incana]|nr:TRFL7 [Hirschfeldia incana]
MALSQWKEAILEGIFTEIKEGLVEEKNLERLENLVEILHKEGSEVPESVKESYCQVAVECTARSLTDEQDAKEAYTEAIRSIWLRRVMPLCDKVSCLVTRDLLNSCKRLWTAHGDDEAREALMDENTREKALASLRKVVSELHPDIDCERDEEDVDDSEECSSEETREEPMEEEEDEEGRLSSLSEEEIPCGGGGALEAESPPPRGMKTISSPVVAEALEKLRGSKIDLMNALAEGGGGGPSNLHVASIIQQENDVDDPAAANELSLMERRVTAQTSEWKDSIDGCDGETGDDGEVRGEWIVVSPWKRNQGGGRRSIIPWSTAETLAVVKGYEKYGANWKRIKDECPILVRRSNGDIKDKYRVQMRRQGGHP